MIFLEAVGLAQHYAHTVVHCDIGLDIAQLSKFQNQMRLI